MQTAKTGLLIFDKDLRGPVAHDMRKRLLDLAAGMGIAAEPVEVGRDDIPACIGCLDCITKHPGSCVFDRAVRPLTKLAASRHFVGLVATASFGAPSSGIKNIVDRGWLIMAPASRQFLIGIGESASDEEAVTFVDTVAKHRGDAEIVHTRVKETIAAFFSRSLADNAGISARVGGFLADPAGADGR